MSAVKPSKTIGLVFSSISEQFRDNFFDKLAFSFQEKGYYSAICLTHGDIELERKYIRQLAIISDGIVVMSCARKYDEIADVVPTNIPVIFAFNQPEGCPETSIIESDYSAIYQGVISIANRGMHKMAFVCSRFEQSYTSEIFKAFSDAIGVISPGSDPKERVFDINIDDFHPKDFLEEIISNDFDSVLCTTSTLTSSIVDTMLVYQTENPKFSLPVLGYSYADKLYSNRLYASIIVPSYDEIINLTVQQLLYNLSHKNNEKRAFLLKGTLHMNQFTLN